MVHDLPLDLARLPLQLLSLMVMEAMLLFLCNSRAMLVDLWVISTLPCKT